MASSRAARRRRAHRAHHFLKHQPLRGMLEILPFQPAQMAAFPGAPAVEGAAVAQQEAGDLLALAAAVVHRLRPRAHQVAHCLMGCIRYPDGGEFARAVQALSCPRFSWTAICPTGGRHDEIGHDQDRTQRCE